MQHFNIETPRNNDRTLIAPLRRFKPSTKSVVGTSGNIKSLFEGSLNLKTFKTDGGIFNGKCFYEAVSAPMLLARLCAGFNGLEVITLGQDAYKCTWEVVLEHPSGHIITFYDFKGGASFGSDVYARTPDTEEFLQDVEALLLSLTNDRFPHPYDGCVVGEIA